MADLPVPANPQFVDVYELKIGDVVLGGPGGIDNIPHMALVERDEFLKARQEGILTDLGLINGRLSSLELASGTSVRAALQLEWLYGDESPAFELWAPGFSFRDIDPVGIIETTNGDDTIDVASTEGLEVGRIYVIENAEGQLLETIEIASVLTDKRVRARLNVGTTLTEVDGARLARTSAEVLDGYAMFSPGDAYYSKVITNLRVQAGGQLFLRRSAAGAGVFTLSYRVDGSETWADATLLETVARAPDTRDEEYAIAVGGSIELRITYAGAEPERVDHLAILPPAKDEQSLAVGRPTNVTPADQAINVGQTPTLTLSAFRSLYGLTQAGAEFQVANDPAFSDIVVNSSSDFIASWNAVAGQSDNFTDIVALGIEKYLLISNGVSIRTEDFTATFDTGSVTGDLKAVDHDAGLVCAVGASGTIRTSVDDGDTYTNRAAAAAYTGTFNGVDVRGAFIVAVGSGGEIQRSINGGAIFNQVGADGGYVGTFTDLDGDGAGNLIAVGTAGEIQTSSNDGQTWTKRNAAGGYNADFQSVAMDTDGNAIAVGANGAIHTSEDYGATWTAQAADDAFAGIFHGVAIKGLRAVVVGATGEIQTSEDLGQTWVARVAGGGASGTIQAIALDSEANALAIGDGGLVQKTLKLTGVGVAYSVPAGDDLLQTNSIYWWRGRLQDVEGAWSPWSAGTAFATAAVFDYVLQPQNLAPASGDIGVSLLPTMQTGAFGYVGTLDTHAATQWQIGTDAAFSTIAYDSGEVADLVSHAVPGGSVLTDEVTYWWRARHKGTNNGLGPWSVPTSFATQARPDKPSVTAPTNGAEQIALNPTITTSAFSMAGGGVHLKTQYQVALVSSFASLVHDSGASGDLLSHTLPEGTLDFGLVYYVRVRHQEDGGQWSSYSTAISFTATTAPNVADLFAASLYVGSAIQKTIQTGTKVFDDGGLVWIAERTGIGFSHNLFDSERGFVQIGSNRYIGTNQDSADNGANVWVTDSGIVLGASHSNNFPGSKHVAWSFVKAPGFFDVVEYTGDGTDNRRIPHNLGVRPGMIVVKSYEATGDWFVTASRDVTGEAYLKMNDPGYNFPNNAYWPRVIEAGGTYSSDTHFFVASTAAAGSANENGVKFIAYIFADNPAPEGLVRCGSYTGNGSVSGPQVTLGWKPQFLMVKNMDAVGDWFIVDSERGFGTGIPDIYKAANKSVNEVDAGSKFNLPGTGFNLATNDSGQTDLFNTDGEKYIYMAIREAGA